jgi:hypothetical protein
MATTSTVYICQILNYPPIQYSEEQLDWSPLLGTPLTSFHLPSFLDEGVMRSALIVDNLDGLLDRMQISCIALEGLTLAQELSSEPITTLSGAVYLGLLNGLIVRVNIYTETVLSDEHIFQHSFSFKVDWIRAVFQTLVISLYICTPNNHSPSEGSDDASVLVAHCEFHSCLLSCDQTKHEHAQFFTHSSSITTIATASVPCIITNRYTTDSTTDSASLPVSVTAALDGSLVCSQYDPFQLSGSTQPMETHSIHSGGAFFQSGISFDPLHLIVAYVDNCNTRLTDQYLHPYAQNLIFQPAPWCHIKEFQQADYIEKVIRAVIGSSWRSMCSLNGLYMVFAEALDCHFSPRNSTSASVSVPPPPPPPPPPSADPHDVSVLSQLIVASLRICSRLLTEGGPRPASDIIESLTSDEQRLHVLMQFSKGIAF